ncbi:MAG: FAD-dependent oxidoreductase, partial [Candidatus Omnitrophica bacterium]|nr:FAD-dependent oxidoreductase [Candidatus Omnitrophota bacterium]
MTDYLIVGQGIAGSFLAWNLVQKSKTVKVVDYQHDQSSSIISAGIINPITGKRFAVTPEFDKFYDYARQTYQELETVFDAKFFEEKPILRCFKTQDEKDHWQRKEDDGFVNQYYQDVCPPNKFENKMDDALGSVLLTRSGFCHSQKLLKSFRDFFDGKNMLRNERVSCGNFEITEASVKYQGEAYGDVIFCEGYQAQFNPFFDWLPFNSVKGEIMRIEMDVHLNNYILNKGKWAVPLGNNQWAAGSTYIWDHLDCQSTEQGKKEILDGLSFIRMEKKVLNHQAAVRPVMQDQRPVLGRHPKLSRIHIFNGLGSKGFLMAPYYARRMGEFLVNKIPLEDGINIDRFNGI